VSAAVHVEQVTAEDERMSMWKVLCGIAAGAAVGYVVGAWITGLDNPRSVAIAIAVAGAGWLGVELCKHIERDTERIREGREAVWRRRIGEEISE
jgi:uncharacterized protein YcfJ